MNSTYTANFGESTILICPESLQIQAGDAVSMVDGKMVKAEPNDIVFGTALETLKNGTVKVLLNSFDAGSSLDAYSSGNSALASGYIVPLDPAIDPEAHMKDVAENEVEKNVEEEPLGPYLFDRWDFI